jgi:hypothetical protein
MPRSRKWTFLPVDWFAHPSDPRGSHAQVLGRRISDGQVYFRNISVGPGANDAGRAELIRKAKRQIAREGR